MVRLVGLALLVGSLSAAAWSMPPTPQGPIVSQPEDPAPQRGFDLSGIATYSDDVSGRKAGYTQIAPGARFGVGVFGLKSERIHQFPATVGEIDRPRTRRAGVGFSFKF